ncbi:MAG TPA: hypothetical protein VG938_15540 [Verrucomicrobiae bacterium]|nr:hypothetical protein [Verrucomicrobiae bacterium]
MEVTTKIVAVTFESFFKRPILHKEAQLDLMAQKCLEAFGAYGLRPTQINLRRGDGAYNYDLSFTLFNGNGSLNVTSEDFRLHLQNATNQKDFEILVDCVVKVYEHLPLPELNSTLITATTQAVAPSAEQAKNFFQQYAKSLNFGASENEVSKCGLIAYVCSKIWPEEIRVSVDRSVIFPDDGLFFTWQTTLKEKKFNLQLLQVLNEACNQASDKLDLVFPREKK